MSAATARARSVGSSPAGARSTGSPVVIRPAWRSPAPSSKSSPTSAGSLAPSVTAITAAAFAANPGGSASSSTITQRVTH